MSIRIYSRDRVVWSIGGPIKGYILCVFPVTKGNLQKGRGLKYERSRVISVLSVEHHISLGSGEIHRKVQNGDLLPGSSENDRTGKTPCHDHEMRTKD